MRLTPDQLIFWQHGVFKLNGTIVFTWAIMLVLIVGSKLITRQLTTEWFANRVDERYRQCAARGSAR